MNGWMCRLFAGSLAHTFYVQAFGINVYNTMISYGFMKVGLHSDSSRSAFFNKIQFNIGGYIFSFQEWEHGILRANQRPPYSMSAPFGKKDPRLELALKETDCRIHFGLNCGARSCPPVRTFSADDLENELNLVAQSFCEDDGNVQLDLEKGEIRLSKIFYWYIADFGGKKSELPQYIVRYVRGMKKQTMEKIVSSGSSKVRFLEYDWSPNVKSSFAFDAASLGDRKSTEAILSH